MESPNVIGYVTEILENKVLDENGAVKETTVELKVKVKNTLGDEKEFWVSGPSDLVDFFAI